LSLTEEEILVVLRQSDRWGINLQPVDVASFARYLASLPCASVRMKGEDTCIVTFERPLTSEEADALSETAGMEESPYTPGVPATEAFLWWD
jgi:hypothetical protein